MIGFGSESATLHVYIDKRPPMEEYANLAHCKALEEGEVAEIARLTGNHWRKILNIYAKLTFSLHKTAHPTWQLYRDKELLQKCSYHSLRFDLPIFSEEQNTGIHIVMGKSYLQSIIKAQPHIVTELYWSDQFFAINERFRLIVCPYFDYRQLSDLKIEQLRTIIRALIH